VDDDKFFKTKVAENPLFPTSLLATSKNIENRLLLFFMACRSDVGVVKLRHDPHADMRWDSTQYMKIKSRWEGKRENPREAAKQNNAPGLLPLSFFSLRNSNLNLIFLKNKSWKTKKDGHEENVRLVDCNATMTTTTHVLLGSGIACTHLATRFVTMSTTRAELFIISPSAE